MQKYKAAGAAVVVTPDVVMSALASARNRSDYNNAKQLAEQLDTIEQMALIDSFIECNDRLGLRRSK